MLNQNPSECLINVLQSTSFLLEHYRYNLQDPSLSDFQRLLTRAITQLKLHIDLDFKCLAT
jgi:hypothetical protein